MLLQAKTAILASTIFFALGFPGFAGDTLEKVKERGYLRCGVPIVSGLDFSFLDSSGRWQGFDVDFCRAIAAAVLGNGERVEFIELGETNRFDALREGDVEVLIRATTWTYTRDAGLGISFPAVTLYDAQGFMTRRSSGITSLQDEAVRNTKVCVNKGTTTLLNLRDYIEKTEAGLIPVEMDSIATRWEAFVNGRCELVTSDQFDLLSSLKRMSTESGEFVILEEVISKEPLGPSVRDGDPGWFDIVRWVVFATIAAEEKGISSKNVEALAGSDDPETRRMLGVDPSIGSALGLDDRWIYRIISQIGNYGEIYDRTIGDGAPTGFDRGLNRLWTDGGLMYAMPFR